MGEESSTRPASAGLQPNAARHSRAATANDASAAAPRWLDEHAAGIIQDASEEEEA